jgi:hypothetical protein
MSRKLLHLTLDIVAAVLLGAAAWFALSSLQLPASLAVAGAGVLTIGVAAALVRLSHDLPKTSAFALAPLEFEQEEEGVLLLDRPVEVRPNSPVVRLLQPIPSPGELHHTIERHLQERRPQAPDDIEKLSEALAQLRRAIR